jgi:hypothetical protein
MRDDLSIPHIPNFGCKTFKEITVVNNGKDRPFEVGERFFK